MQRYHPQVPAPRLPTVKTAYLRKRRFAFPVLLLAFAACSDKNTIPSAATTIEPNSATTISAVAGTPTTPAPSVIVRDQNGSPFAGAPVTFAVTEGGGTITGASAVTDASGVATVGGWTLGKTAGSNTLTASTGTLSVNFTATGIPGPAALMTISAGDNQSAAAGATVPIPPAVLVKDANGNVTSGVTVTFTVGQGGGVVTGATATSNASGIATAGSWQLGAGGPNTLIAAAAGTPSVTFQANAIVTDKCTIRTAHTLGSTTSGVLETDDCKFSDGSFVDFFSTSLPQANGYLFGESAGFHTYLDVALADGTVIAESGNSTQTTSSIKALLPAGTYLLGASSYGPGITGSYTVSSQVTSADNAKCEVVFVVRNVTTNQNIAPDCGGTGSGGQPIYADIFYILLRAGESITIDMMSTAVDAYLELRYINSTSDAPPVAQNDDHDATTKDAQLTFTASRTDYYAIVARTAVGSQTGAYTLTIR